MFLLCILSIFLVFQTYTGATPVYVTHLWHMHQPIYTPGDPAGDDAFVTIQRNGTSDGKFFSYSLHDMWSSKGGPYRGWATDAIEQGLDLPHLGAQIDLTGSLVESLNNLEANNWNSGYYNNWKSRFYTGMNYKTVLNHSRLDVISFPYHHPLMGLLWNNDIVLHLLMNQKVLEDNFPGYTSKGIFPPETCFSIRNIPALLKAGIEWVMIDNIHFFRTLDDYPWTPNSGVIEPNKADQLNGTSTARGATWVQLNGLWAPDKVAAGWGYRPHYSQYIDPDTGAASKIMVVPAACYEGNEDARGGFGALNYDYVIGQLLPYNNDPSHPQIVLLHHDGENYGAGVESYYHGNYGNYCNWLRANPSQYQGTTIQDYLDQFTPDTADIIHVENGGWIGSGCLSPEFHYWLGDPNPYPSGQSPDWNSWAVITAARSWVMTAYAKEKGGDYFNAPLSIAGEINNKTTSIGRALHYYTRSQASCYEYWEGGPDEGIWNGNPSRSCNRAIQICQSEIGINSSSDYSIGPSIFIPQRQPYNPGGAEWGVQQPKDFEVWSFVYDLNGLGNVYVKYKLLSGDTIIDSDKRYGTGTWYSNLMSWEERSWTESRTTGPQPLFKARRYYSTIITTNNRFYAYYIQATDSLGHTSRSPIQFVWVGAGGGTVAAKWKPADPTQNDVITVYGDAAGLLHWGVNNWNLVHTNYWPAGSFEWGDGKAIETPLRHGTSYTLNIGPFNDPQQNVELIDFVFHYSNGSWDNNNGQDYHITITVASGHSPLSIMKSDIASLKTRPNYSNQPILAFKYQDNMGHKLKKLRIKNNGTMIQGIDISRIKIFDDTSTTIGKFNGTENFLDHLYWNSSLFKWTNNNLLIDSGKNLLITADIGASATHNRTFLACTTLTDDITCQSNYTAALVITNRGTLTISTDTHPPSDVFPFILKTGNNSSITLFWTTPAESDFQAVMIRYNTNNPLFPSGTNSGYLLSLKTNIPLTNDSFIHDGLIYDVNYKYTVFSRDDVFNYSGGATNQGTAQDLVPPGNITFFTIMPEDSQLSLTWDNPFDIDLKGILLKRKTGGFPQSLSDGATVLSNVIQESVLDTSLTNGTNYYYMIWAYDRAGNYSVAASNFASPQAQVLLKTIDGDLSDWLHYERMETDGTKKFYFNWDVTNLYFAWDSNDWASDGDMFLYFDTDPGENAGTNISVNWDGTYTLPAKFDWVFCLEDSSWYDLRKFESGSWIMKKTPSSNFCQNYIGWSGNGITEVQLPRSQIGVFSQLRILCFAKSEAGLNVLNTFPSANPAGSVTVFTLFYNLPDLSGSRRPHTEAVLPWPTGLTVTNGERLNILGWKDQYNESDHAGYNIYRSTNTNLGFIKINTSPVNAVSYMDSGLNPFILYYYFIRGVLTDARESSDSIKVSAMPFDHTGPSPVIAFYAQTGASNSVILYWTNPPDPDFRATLIRCSTNTLPLSPTNGQLLCLKTNAPGSLDSFALVLSDIDRTNYFSAFAFDIYTNYSSGVSMQFSFQSLNSDTAAPFTTADKESGSYLGEIDVILTATDDKSGVERIYYTTDGTDPKNSITVTSGLSPVTIMINRKTILKFYARDVAGNQETVRSNTYEILLVPKDDFTVYNNELTRGEEQVRIIINKASRIRIHIYNLTGVLVRSYPETDYPAGSIVQWDGRVESTGQKARAGLYIIHIKGEGVDKKLKLMIRR